jgi:LysR family transcriptional regulator, transcriptional activator of the cysJI operon
MMSLNLHLLRIFFTVVEQQSFSRAARALFISQPAVSKAVRELEHQLGLELIERNISHRKGVRLTGNGSALFGHARGTFALERVAVEDVQARIDLRRGKLVIGASFTIAGYWLPEYVAKFTRQYPSIDLQVRVGNTQAISDALIDCNIDLALVEGVVNDPRIASAHWQDDALCIVAAADAMLARKQSVDIDDLNKEIWLWREPGSGTREVSEHLMFAHQIKPVRVLEFGSNEGISRAVAAGAGLAMLPTIVVRELIKVGEISTLHFPLDKVLQRPLFLLQLRERALSPLALAFSKIL